MLKFNSLMPGLRVSNIENSKDFYLKIGFKVMYEIKEDKFYFLQLENNQIMIEEGLEEWKTGELEYPFGRGINLSMEVSNVDELYRKVKEEKITIFEKLKSKEYKVGNEISYDKEFLIQDPNGYLLRFTN